MVDGRAKAALKLIKRAPAATASLMAAASSSGLALGNAPFLEVVSPKMGRTSNVHPGQIAGAGEPLLAHKIPATKVPCTQAALLVCEQLAPLAPGTSRIFAAVRSGLSKATGPSSRPTATSRAPPPSPISGVSPTESSVLVKVDGSVKVLRSDHPSKVTNRSY